MTEEEAKTKWCPHAIASHTNPRQHNGEVWLHNCLGSACMAWRRDDPARELLRFYKDDARRETMVSAGTMRVIDGEPWRYEYSDCDEKGEFELLHRARPENGPKSSGYCGLAGKP